MTAFWQDFRYALRMIAKAPGYAAIAILRLALGIGANTTIFRWINASLLNPVPGLASPREVVALSLGTDSANPFPFTYPDLEALRNGQQSQTIGWTAEVGTVEKGKFADLVAVVGDPLADITEMFRVVFVMKGGQIVRNDAIDN